MSYLYHICTFVHFIAQDVSKVIFRGGVKHTDDVEAKNSRFRYDAFGITGLICSHRCDAGGRLLMLVRFRGKVRLC